MVSLPAARSWRVWLGAALASLSLAAAAQPNKQGSERPERGDRNERVERFADLSFTPETPSFAAGRKDFTSDAELAAFIARLDASSNTMTWRILGKSPGGRDIHLMVFSSEGKSAAPELAATRKPVVWLIGQQHGNEPAGAEAALEVARRLAVGDLRSVLDKLTVVVLPRANPDGAASNRRETSVSDQNRDHLQLATLENQLLHRAMRAMPPALVIDAHEFAPAGRLLERFGVTQASDVLVQSASHPEISEAIRTLSRESFDPALDAAFKKAGLRSHLYHFLIDRPGQPNDKPLITAGGNYAGIARNTFGLYGAVSYLIETRGIGLGREHWQRRVGAHVLAASALIRTAATNVEALRRANAAARNGWTGDITVDYESRREVREVPVIDALTGEDRNLRVDFINTLQVTPSIRRSIPVGYILGPDQEAAAQRLAQHGLRVVRLYSATDANVERFIMRTPRNEAPEQGVPGDRVVVDTQTVTLNMPAGSFLVPMNQPLARVAAVALEPDAPGSFVATKLIRTNPASGTELPVYRLLLGLRAAGPLVEAP
ncbi:M14 family metallopeptidase [Piscinibacterium candidicorallinum]|uniref:M14 family metallopeptidase n=1 Tax=Piscinibacterium candidicorallinum TaxID=1793872 RepID=A0ABV7H4R2_9BURK